MNLSDCKKLCDALVELMKPLVEIVIHDLSSGNICYVKGNLSKRKESDPSLLEAGEIKKNVVPIAYHKINFNGGLIKSISVPVGDKWLICINSDVSLFNQMKNMADLFLSVQSDQPASLFKNDWQEKLHVAIHDFLQTQRWNFDDLSASQKKKLVRYLFDSGAFEEKKSAEYIARRLDIGRATIFNYLKVWRNA